MLTKYPYIVAIKNIILLTINENPYDLAHIKLQTYLQVEDNTNP